MKINKIISLILIIVFACLAYNKVQSFQIKKSFSKHDNKFFIDINSVYPGQIRYSKVSVELKKENLIKNNDVIWNEKTQNWEMKYFNKESAISLLNALPVIKGPYGFVLVDGHHHFLSNLAIGGKKIPVFVIADLSNLSEEEFLKVAEEKGWIHPYDIYGNKIKLPQKFSDLVDDPNRFFAVLSKRLYSEDLDIKTSKGAKYPIWIKVGKDIPFIEMRISEALYRANLIYDNNQGHEPDQKFYEKAREVILQADIEGLRVVSKRTNYNDLNISE